MKNEIVEWIAEYASKNKITSLVVGVSGGVDSAVVSTLCAMTGMPTYLVSMPISQSKKELTRAARHMEWLKSNFRNVDTSELDLGEPFEHLDSVLIGRFGKSDLASANTRSRLRMITLYHVACLNNGIVVGTGNKVEDFGVGFFTKYGDGGVDISPIADLTKSQVRQLGADLEIEESIVTAKPTDGLWDDGRSDEDQIGASYEELEAAMIYMINNDSHELTNREKEVLDIYNYMHLKNSHKMLPIPTFRLNEL
jgi:NAD+ synthase